jgi:hypothetical protein
VVDLNKPNLFNNYGRTTLKDYELHVPRALSSNVHSLRGHGRSSLTPTTTTASTTTSTTTTTTHKAPPAQGRHAMPHHVVSPPALSTLYLYTLGVGLFDASARS